MEWEAIGYVAGLVAVFVIGFRLGMSSERQLLAEDYYQEMERNLPPMEPKK